jgi:hypothetical protein
MRMEATREAIRVERLGGESPRQSWLALRGQSWGWRPPGRPSEWKD